MRKLRPVLIEWQDAGTVFQGWEQPEDFTHRGPTIVSVGLLVSRDKSCFRLVQMQDVDFGATGGRHVIPAGSVIKWRYLR